MNKGVKFPGKKQSNLRFKTSVNKIVYWDARKPCSTLIHYKIPRYRFYGDIAGQFRLWGGVCTEFGHSFGHSRVKKTGSWKYRNSVFIKTLPLIFYFLIILELLQKSCSSSPLKISYTWKAVLFLGKVIYIIKQDIHIYIYMLRIAGQTAGPIGLTFLWTLRGGGGCYRL